MTKNHDETSFAPPVDIELTEAAVEAFRDALREASGDEAIQINVDVHFKVSLGTNGPLAGHQRFTIREIPFLIDADSAVRAQGMSIDYVESGGAGGFKIENPNAPSALVEISATELKQRLDAGEFLEFFDVRTVSERERAKIDGARLLDEAAMAHIEGLDRSTPLVFH